MGSEKEGYDQTVTMFSPEGRIYQAEYARVAAKRGSIAMAVKYKDGILVVANKGPENKLVRMDRIEKLFRINSHMLAATSGLIADARVLVDYMRSVAVWDKLHYGANPESKFVVKDAADVMWAYTEYGGVRPFGVMAIVAGFHEGKCAIHEVDVTGNLTEFDVLAIGHGSEEAMEMFESEYKPDMTQKAAAKLLVKALKEAIDGDLDGNVIDSAVVDEKGIEMLDVKTLKKLSS